MFNIINIIYLTFTSSYNFYSHLITKNIILYRYDGVCDKDGCDFGSWRLGDHEYYGPGPEFKIDTTRPFTVVTQFITDDGTANGNLISVGRKYVQDGNVIENSKVGVNNQ